MDNGEDTNSLSYDPEHKDFRCHKGHVESAEQMFRFDGDNPELIRIIMDLLEQGNKNTEHPADKDDRLYHEEQDHIAMEKAKVDQKIHNHPLGIGFAHKDKETK